MHRIVIILLGLGICFRFVNLDHKVYWFDETFTSLRSAGYTEAEIVEHFHQTTHPTTHPTTVVKAADLQTFQQVAPGRGLADTLHSLGVEDLQHPPLYYVLSSIWMRHIGSSVTAMRTLPALLSLLAVPCMYWLCWELFVANGEFTSALPAWIGVGLVAVSPLHVLYAQESRQYSLWSVTTLLATASLLWALRTKTAISWIVYALSLALSFYTFLFSGLVAIAHGIYVLGITNARFTKTAITTVIAYFIASLAAVALFAPWAWKIATNLEQAQAVTSWTSIKLAPIALVSSWASILGRLFYDQEGGIVTRLIQLGIIVLIGVAFYTLCRRTPRSVWSLVVLLTGVLALTLMIPDLVLGGLRSTFPRYLIPSLLGIQIAVTYLLAFKLTHSVNSSERTGAATCWRWITGAVLTAGIVSCLVLLQEPVWWVKTLNKENPSVAEIINQADRPLVLSDAETGDLLSLSYLLDEDTDLLIRPRCYTCHIDAPEGIHPSLLDRLSDSAQDYTTLFLFHPRANKEWRRSLQQLQNYQLETVLSNPSHTLWKIVKKATR